MFLNSEFLIWVKMLLVTVWLKQKMDINLTKLSGFIKTNLKLPNMLFSC